MKLFEKIFGTHSENELKRIYPIADRIEALEPEMQALTVVWNQRIESSFQRPGESGSLLTIMNPLPED